MKRVSAYIGATLLTLCFTHGATACTFIEPTFWEIVGFRINSKPVESASDCSFENGGLSDQLSGGAAMDLGKGRIAQRLLPRRSSKEDDFLVADCKSREVVRIRSGFRADEDYIEDSCGFLYGEYHALVAPAGPLSLAAGSTLTELVTAAGATGKAARHGQVHLLFEDGYGKKYRKKDRIDVLCGCKVFYPSSAGARP